MFFSAFPSSGGNHQEKAAEGFLCRFPRLRQFPQASPSAAFFLFCFFFLSLLPTGMSRPGTHPRIGELEDRFELLVDLLRQLKWVVCLERLVQLCQLHAIRLSAFPNAFQWRLRWLIDAPQARAHACLSQQLR